MYGLKELQHKLPQNIDADVCIVGCGGGGLAAAVGALESGAKKVIILEKTPRTGGTTRLPGGTVCRRDAAPERTGAGVFTRRMFRSPYGRNKLDMQWEARS